MPHFPRLLASAVGLALTVASASASARVCTWVALRASTFGTSSNWSCSPTGTGAPTSADTVQFTSSSTRGCTISSSASVAAVTISSGYSGTITMSAPLAVSGALSMAGGTLNAGSSTLQAGSISLSGGTLTLSSDTTTVGGDFINSGGTIAAPSGQVVLTGTGTFSPGTSSLNDVTINASGKTVSLGSALLVGGDLTITAGTLAAAAWPVNVSGNWSNAGAFTGSGTVTLSGTSASGTLKSGGSSFSALIVNGSGGVYTLQDALTTTGGLTLTAGTLAAGSSNVAIGGDLGISAGSFIGGAGTVAITGNLAMTGGTYTGGAGSLSVGGSVTVDNAVVNGADPTLVGYWPLDDTSSPSADSSGNGNTLSWSGSPTTTTSVPSAISFTDSRALAMTGSQSASSDNLSGIAALTPSTVTMSAWYKATSADTNGAEIVSGSNTYGLRITSTGVMVMKRISDNTGAADWIEYRVPLSNVLDGKWHQLVGEIVTGTGGGMSVYFDGVVASGNYWVNGSNGASQLSGSSSPTAAAAATAAIDWDANTESFGLVIGNNPSTTGYQFGKGCSGTACALDDVRVYNRALTAAQVAALAHGNQPGGSTGLLTLTGAATVTGAVTVKSTGTLTLSSGSVLAVGTALTIDGSLNSTGGTIQRAGNGRYAFHVGSTASAAPALNINGLTVNGTDGDGMWINVDAGASTTFTRFDSLTFANGTGGQLLRIYASTLNLNSNGCTFDKSATYAIKLTGNGSGNGPFAIFGGATCAVNDSKTGLCATSQKSDDDRNNDGVADHPTTNGAIIQFVHAAPSDTAGTLVGYPTAAFDWNTFSYYSTYVTFHDASNGSDVVYVRDAAGNALYSWTDPSTDETLVGTPQWNTVGGTHYLYVAANGTASNTGKVYRLKDSGTGNTSGSLTLDASWASSGTYSCSCTVKSNLSLDTSNVYWAATTATAQVLMGVTQSSGAKISTSWPVTTPANVTTSAPTLVTKSGTTTLYLGVTNDLLQLAVTGTTFLQNTKPGTITGRVSYGTSMLAATTGTSRIYAGDSSGNMWAISPTSFAGASALWSYAAGGAIINNTYDAYTDTVQFGTGGGKVVVLNAATGAVLNSAYPFTLDTSDPITAAPLFQSGVMVVGTTKGKLYFIDRNTGSGAALINTVNFGSTQSVSTISYDPITARIMAATSSAANDGRIYYFDSVSDPTPSSL